MALAAAMAMPVLALGAHDARADAGLHVSGNVRIRVGSPPVNVRVRSAGPRVRYVRHRRHLIDRPPVRLRAGAGVYWSGGVYVGGFAQPPPPVVHDCGCGPQAVPAHYAPPPVAPVAAVAAPIAPEPRLPRWGIGVFAGSTEIESGVVGEDAGLLGRLRVTDSLLLEAEVAKSRLDELRMDRRLGGAVLYDLAPRSRLSAHLLAGMGVTQVDLGNGSWRSAQQYGELGVGLSFKLSERLHLAGDLRAGAYTPVDGVPQPQDDRLMLVAPSSDHEERYTRGRLSAILSF